jgi:DNA-binding MarR family transcriptional regulator
VNDCVTLSDQPTRDEDAALTLRVLTAIEGQSVVTQRSLARELGIALGLANAYLKRCAAKGLIKVSHIPARRYAYYLTPKGFAEKSQLAARYLSNSLAFVRLAKEQCDEALATCKTQGWGRIVLCGVGEIADIAAMCAHDRHVTILGMVDPEAAGVPAERLPIAGRVKDFDGAEAALITDCWAPQQAYDRVAAELPGERILVLPLLHISRHPPILTE